MGLFLLILAAPAAAETMEEEAARVSEATELEGRARFAGAADVLGPLVDRYPQDYALQMRVAWDLYRAERFASALPHYEAAADLSGGTPDSHLGLGWTLLSLGRCRDARTHWEAALDGPGDHPLALEGQAICENRIGSRVAVEVGGVGHLYRRHPSLLSGFGGFTSLDAVVEGVFLVGATYRLVALESVNESTGPGPGPGGTTRGTSFASQHEVHGRVGMRWASGDVRLAYGYVSSDVPQLFTPMHAVGALLRLRPFGELVFEASAALATGSQVLRFAPSWWLPVTDWLLLRPGGAVQAVIDGGVYGAGELTVLVHGEVGSLWVGGRGGAQYHAVFFEQPTIYNIEDTIREGAWLGGTVRLGGGFSVRVDYEMQRRLVPMTDGSEQEAWAHFGVLRLRWEST